MNTTLDALQPHDYEPCNDTFGSETRKRKITCRRELLISSLQRFYGARQDLDTLIPILHGQGNISLRLIDWFVTNYAKTYNVSYMVNNQEFLVYHNYKSQLKAYSKKLFDPFCRRERIIFQCGTHEGFMTTVGQLNFFRWAFEKNILEYIKDHYEDIVKEEKQARSVGTQSSRSTLENNLHDATVVESVSSKSTTSANSRKRKTEKNQTSKLLFRHNVEVTLTFQ